MAGEFTIAQANGILKTVYGKLQNVLPESALLQKKYGLDSSKLVGDHFEEPVVVRMPQGHSFNGSAGAVVALNSPRAGKTVPAQVFPSEYVLREQVSYGLLDRAKTQGTASFEDAMKLEGQMMTTSGRNLLEIQSLWGQTSTIGTCASNISSHVVTITAGELSPGILSLLENAQLDFISSDLTTRHVQNAIVSAVDTDAGTITLDGTVTDTSIVTGDLIFFAGEVTPGSPATFSTQMGLYKQMAGANGSGSTGTVFNIDKAQYNLWRASVVSSVGELTPSSFIRAITKLQNKGFASGELDCWVSPRSWGVLNSALAVAETYPGGYQAKRKTGTDDIQINNGGIAVNVWAHPFMKEGYAMLLPSNYMKRVGAVDFTFAFAGTDSEFLRDVPGFNAMERQARAQWQMFLERPSWSALLTGITYSS